MTKETVTIQDVLVSLHEVSQKLRTYENSEAHAARKVKVLEHSNLNLFNELEDMRRRFHNIQSTNVGLQEQRRAQTERAEKAERELAQVKELFHSFRSITVASMPPTEVAQEDLTQ